ncbi:MAG: M48 family metallopeptidase, partial [Deinococcales bacterium]|nr:M48 family metallopeptidase [Deinococcales bacterium]
YIVVHEVAHLLVPDHGPRFKALMSRHVPRWRELDAELDAWPLWAPLPAGADLRAP